MLNWVKEHKKGIIRGMFLIPILLVMIISISHVVSWYDLSNPFSWAVYLSVAIEIAAMSSIAAASVRVRGGVWLVFIIVTLIQFIGNIYFCYNDIDANSKEFKSWVELTSPVFESLGSDVTNIISQKRWLALLEGGLLPIISLASLHFFIKYGGMDDEKVIINEEPKVNPPKPTEPQIQDTPIVESPINVTGMENSNPSTEMVIEEPIIENIVSEPIIEQPIEVINPTPQAHSLFPHDSKTLIDLNNKKKAEGTDKWG